MARDAASSSAIGPRPSGRGWAAGGKERGRPERTREELKAAKDELAEGITRG